MHCFPILSGDLSIRLEQETLSNNFIVIFSKVSAGFENKLQDFRQLQLSMWIQLRCKSAVFFQNRYVQTDQNPCNASRFMLRLNTDIEDGGKPTHRFSAS